MTLPAHGGNLPWASATFNRPLAEWVDLSTGISPWVYPVPDIPSDIWQSLPYDVSPLLHAAAMYYRCAVDALTPVAGTQFAIRLLPTLLSPSSVAIPAIGYTEHYRAWLDAGHEVKLYDTQAQLQEWIEHKRVKHVVVINPNNPTSERYTSAQLLNLVKQLDEDAYFIVDEAFMDVNPEHSLSAYLHQKLIILRSVGKFFGLAGLRLGFVLGLNPLVNQLRLLTEPWGVSHPALWLGEKVLNDHLWQQQQRERIQKNSSQLQQCFSQLDHTSFGNGGLFCTLLGSSQTLYHYFLSAAEQGILLRYHKLTDDRAWLRCGITDDKQLIRLNIFVDQVIKNK